MTDNEELLRQFFGGEFHQDWDLDGASSWQEVVAKFSADVPKDHLDAVRSALVEWLGEVQDDREIAFRLSTDLACDYNPRGAGLTATEWVRAIVGELDRLRSKDT